MNHAQFYGSFYTFKIKGEQINQKPQELKREPSWELPEYVAGALLILRGDLPAIIFYDLVQHLLHFQCKLLIYNVHVQFDTGIGAKIVNIIGTNSHPLPVAYCDFSVKYGRLIFI